MAKLKPISFYDRTNNPVHNKEFSLKHPVHRVLTFEDVLNEKTGVVCKKSKYVTVDRQKEMKHYSISDFSLSNMLSIGATLTPTKLVADTDMKMTHIENMAQTIASQLNENNN